MRYLIFLLIVVFRLDAATVCLNMIVKDEAHVIRRCLESVKPIIDTWVIVDTGSTDGTQKIIKEYMKDIPGKLYERKWVDFAHNRNEALQLAKNKGDYLLFIDADDILVYEEGFILPELNRDCYDIVIDYNMFTYRRPHLVKSSLPWKWEGVVHEALVCDIQPQYAFLDKVYMKIVGGGDRSKDTAKYLKDAKILEKALQKEPNHARYQFYLAQSYRDAHQYDKAIKAYEKRIAMGGWDEEIFQSYLRIAQLKKYLNQSEEVVSKAYIAAYLHSSHRAEPLFELSKYYREKGNYFMGYLLSRQVLNLPKPDDLLFVEPSVYEYGTLLEFSICAYWIGNYLEAYETNKKILSQNNLPPAIKECVVENLRFCVQKLAPNCTLQTTGDVR